MTQEWVEKTGKCLGINSRRLLSNRTRAGAEGGGAGGGEERRRKTWRLKGIDEKIKRRVLSYFQQKIDFNFPS